MLTLFVEVPVTKGQFSDHHDDHEDNESTDDDSNTDNNIDASHVLQDVIETR